MSDVSPGDVKDTAKQQARRVGTEAKVQARTVAADARDRITDQAHTQNDRLVGNIRQTADHLDEMRGTRPDTPAARVVAQVADGGRQFADYLERHGPEGVLREVQDFARRRPGAFLATALAAGFVVGRLGKGVAKAGPSGKPANDSFVSGGGYPAADVSGGGYPAGDYPTGGVSGTAGHPSGSPDETGYAPGRAAGIDEPTMLTRTSGNTTEYASTGTGRPYPVDDERALPVDEDRTPRNPESRP